ncbi:MAG TPA: slipin family protein [Kofleriaceae bacterium]|nr:slipin family protein [Kofleriaceae bacterium]
MLLYLLLGIAFFGGMGALTSLRVLREYERAIVFRLGRARRKALGPGVVLMLPFGVDRAMVVDTRTKVIQIPPQEVITRDNISIGVDAVVYVEIASPMDAILRVEQYLPATLQLAATTLRSIIGRMELDEVLAKRAEINTEVQEILEARVEQWGVNITAVEIKDISLPAEMKRAMARQAEAERERRAKIIMSDGELQAAQRLAEAARLMASDPAALQLRLYQTMVEVASQPNMTIVLPVPVELLAGGGGQAAAAAQVAQAVASAAGSLAAGANAKQLSASAPASEPTEALKSMLAESGKADAKVPR